MAGIDTVRLLVAGAVMTGRGVTSCCTHCRRGCDAITLSAAYTRLLELAIVPWQAWG